MPNRRGIVRIVITLLLLYSLLCFARADRALAEMEHTAASLEQERELLEQEHRELEMCLLQREDPDRMEALARQELGMVMPGEIVFLFTQEEESNLEQTERDPLWHWK